MLRTESPFKRRERRAAGRRPLRRRLLAGLALALVSFALAVGAVEVALRVSGLAISSIHRGLATLAALQVLDRSRDLLEGPPERTAMLFGHEARFNRLGARDEEPELPKPDGRFRILCLGDSVTFGQGVAQEDMYPAVLRSDLASATLDVVAAGMPGWNTVSELRFLEKYVDTIAPDLVVLLYVYNDYERVNPFHRARRPPGGIGERLYRALLTHSRLFEWTVYVWRSRIAGPDLRVLAESKAWEALLAAQGAPYATSDPGWLASRAALVAMRDLLASRGARLVVMLFDLGDGLASGLPVRERLGELADAEGIAVVDTLPFFGGRTASGLMVQPGVDPHPNAEGHRLLADGIRRTLEQRGLLPGRPTGPGAGPAARARPGPAPDRRTRLDARLASRLSEG